MLTKCVYLCVCTALARTRPRVFVRTTTFACARCALRGARIGIFVAVVVMVDTLILAYKLITSYPAFSPFSSLVFLLLFRKFLYLLAYLPLFKKAFW